MWLLLAVISCARRLLACIVASLLFIGDGYQCVRLQYVSISCKNYLQLPIISLVLLLLSLFNSNLHCYF